jgi:uroporphyrinogen decarboxylase
MEPEKLKAEIGDRIVLIGAIDTQMIIETKPDLVRAETRRVLDIMKPGGGYIASPSHDYVLPETPVENLLAVYEIVRECGSYS